jgi:hypothetical protein
MQALREKYPPIPNKHWGVDFDAERQEMTTGTSASIILYHPLLLVLANLSCTGLDIFVLKVGDPTLVLWMGGWDCHIAIWGLYVTERHRRKKSIALLDWKSDPDYQGEIGLFLHSLGKGYVWNSEHSLGLPLCSLCPIVKVNFSNPRKTGQLRTHTIQEWSCSFLFPVKSPTSWASGWGWQKCGMVSRGRKP